MLNNMMVLTTNLNHDIRGKHSKFFGSKQREDLQGFEVREVFMTTSNKNVVRGMHFQTPGQPKLIQVISGSIMFNALCCNPELKNVFGTSVNVELSAEDAKSFFIPGDWAPGYRALEDNTRVLYLAGADFAPDGDVGINPFDPALNLYWGENFTPEDAIMAPRDRELPPFENFVKSLDQAREGM